MEPFKNITCLMVFFTHSTLSDFITSLVLFTKLHLESIEWVKRRFFAYKAPWAYHVISRRKKVTSSETQKNWIFRHKCLYKQPTLTKQWDYNSVVQIGYSYFRYTGRLFLGYALFVARCDITRASWETKKERLSYRKKYIEEFLWGTSHFWLHALLPVSFSLLS